MADLKVKISEFPLATEAKDSDDIAILQDGVNKRIKTPKIEAKILEKVSERYVNKNQLGVNNGVATLGSDGKLSDSQRFAVDINPDFIPIDLTTPPSEVDGVFVPTTSGVYENYGGLSIDLDLGSYLITKIGDTYKSILLAVESTLIANNIEDLRSKEPAYEGQIITLLGYYEAGDKEPLNYKWTSEQGIDDGGGVINTEGGSWQAIFTDSINTRDFGAISTSLDSSININNAIKHANSAGIKTVINDIEVYVSSPNDRYNGAIQLQSNVFFRNKGTISLRPNDFPNYAIISANAVSNVGLEVGTIIGDKNSHLGSTGEWGMGVSFRDVNEFTILNGTIKECWGDGIYLSGDSSAPGVYSDGCISGIIDNVQCDDNRRNGTSIVAGKNIKITNCLFSRTVGTAPMAGLDIEPNTNQKCSNIVVDNCTFKENGSMALSCTSHGIASATRFIGQVEDIKIVNCDFNDGRVQFSQSTSATSPVVTDITVDNCSLKSINTYGFNMINGVSRINIINSRVTLEKTDPDSTVVGIRLYAVTECYINNNEVSQIGSIIGNHGIRTEELSADCAISNNRITGFSVGVSNGAGSYNKIVDNIIKSCITGIISYGLGARISNNDFKDISGVGISLRGHGFTTVSNNYIDKYTSENDSSCIELDGVSNNTISNNIILASSSVRSCIREAPSTSNNAIINNICTGSSDSIFSAGSFNIIMHNRVSDCSSRGIWVYGNNSKIIENNVINTGLAGIELNGSNYSLVKNNNLSENGIEFDEGTGRCLYLTGNTLNTKVLDNYINNSEDKYILYGIENGPGTNGNQIINNTILGNITTSIRIFGNEVVYNLQAQQSEDTAEEAPVEYDQLNIQSILDELRDLKNKLRQVRLLKP